jgi:hypothetical protein
MTKLEESAPTPKDSVAPPPPSPKKDGILFQSIFDTVSKKSEPNINDEPTSQPSSKKENDTPPDTILELNQSNTSFGQLFPELGISTVNQIKEIIVTVSTAVESTAGKSSIETFSISNGTHPFQVQVIKHPNKGWAIKINCPGPLHQLLTNHMPELKKQLKKKGIDTDEILLTKDDELPKKLPPLKNNI